MRIFGCFFLSVKEGVHMKVFKNLIIKIAEKTALQTVGKSISIFGHIPEPPKEVKQWFLKK